MWRIGFGLCVTCPARYPNAIKVPLVIINHDTVLSDHPRVSRSKSVYSEMSYGKAKAGIMRTIDPIKGAHRRLFSFASVEMLPMSGVASCAMFVAKGVLNYRIQYLSPPSEEKMAKKQQ